MSNWEAEAWAVHRKKEEEIERIESAVVSGPYYATLRSPLAVAVVVGIGIILAVIT